ncbi:chitobiase/beta-hexosaminidase C-terminal domain-containing protein [Mobilitalea sibirica]|uniref:Chitobiase/beta-hexosaminidase C-terminal domain-containing protein n=1 Tax=Mobilitalea sibirica TaxID=1462919 RepID=A0A8J7KRV8_9FIRM|nr:chitobiase/beta-hexosaminidase C-terminal domain-containing protein [Mobilitalea sibirica]MBH1939681.1 chitobiase/beta-hexosaminidase C-terminal domain-containing protein [Mobilitalea sibirica]
MGNQKERKKLRLRHKSIITGLALVLLIGVLGFLLLYSKDDKIAGYKQRGNEYLLKGDYEKAVGEFGKVVELNPEDIVSCFQLAEAYSGMEDYSTAIKYLTMALAKAEELTTAKEMLKEGNTIEQEQYSDIEVLVALYRKLAEYYEMSGNQKQRVEVLKLGFERTGSTVLVELLKEYYPDEVTADRIEGEYIVDDALEISLAGKGTIYYTLDGLDPTKKSKEYRGKIKLLPGTHNIKAVVWNEFDLSSNINTFTFIVKEKDDNISEEANHTKNDRSGSTKTYSSELDEGGNIIWADPKVEAVVRNAIGKKVGKISETEAKSYKGSLDLSDQDIHNLEDLIWFENLSVLSCRGNDLADAAFINDLKLDRVIAVYHNTDEVKAADNTQVLKELNHLGINLSGFSVGEMSIVQMLDFIGTIERTTKKLTNLEYLDLSNNELNDISILGEFDNVPNVKYLILKNNNLENINVLAEFKNLVYVDLTDNNIKDYSPVEHVVSVVGKK